MCVVKVNPAHLDTNVCLEFVVLLIFFLLVIVCQIKDSVTFYAHHSVKQNVACLTPSFLYITLDFDVRIRRQRFR